MKNNGPNKQGGELSDDIPVADAQLDELRNLIVGPERKQLADLRERMDSLKPDAEEIGDILPDAVSIREKKDKTLSRAFLPTIEKAIKISVARDSRFLADTLYPVMGPSIRKAIYEALRQMHQSLNKVLEKSFSWQGLKWRLESLKTGKSFAETVLYHTLVYQVEQVFLIHRETGLVLHHLVAENSASQDADMISSMLTAIQDFVKDSFNLKDGENLQTMHVGDITIWIEQGPHAVLAGAIRGNPPEDLRSVFQEALETIHLEYGAALVSFDGDSSDFKSTKDYLKTCMAQAVKETKKRKVSRPWIMLGAVAVAVILWTFVTMRDNRRWQQLLEKIDEEAGIVVTSAEKQRGRYYITGMRDPLSADPGVLIQESNINPEKVISRWDYYHSVNDKFLIARVTKALKPPPTVSLRLEDGTLIADGEAFHRWIADSRMLVRSFTTIHRYDESGLVDLDKGKFDRLKKSIEKYIFLFPVGKATLSSGQEAQMENYIADILNLADTAEVLGRIFTIRITGHTDNTGPESRNLRLSWDRAGTLSTILLSRGIHLQDISVMGAGENESDEIEISPELRKYKRNVTTQITYK